MTNEELIMHAREFLATPNLGRDMARELDKALIYIRELAVIAEAAEARVKELEAGEWEWRARNGVMSGPIRVGPTTAKRALEERLDDYPFVLDESERAVIVEKRHVSDWVPVESEGE